MKIKVSELPEKIKEYKDLEHKLSTFVGANDFFNITFKTERSDGINATLSNEDELFRGYYLHIRRVVKEVILKANENVSDELFNMTDRLEKFKNETFDTTQPLSTKNRKDTEG